MTQRKSNNTRRGNSIVLVAGLLVLLVIVATAYVTRTRAERRTSRAIADTQLRVTKSRQIAENLAGEIATALFAHPIDVDPNTGDPDILLRGWAANSNHPRLSPMLVQQDPDNPVRRYQIDQDIRDVNGAITMSTDGDAFPDGDGVPDYPYNFAPYQVVPFTNWPDPPSAVNQPRWPGGPGNPGGGGFSVLLEPEHNPLGNPGFGDSRWLADIEPIRIATKVHTTSLPELDSTLDVYSHWRHMTNISRPNNGWRIVTDISDIFDSDGDDLGALLTNLSIPVEQWLAVRPTSAPRYSATGDVDVSDLNFDEAYGLWFFNYQNVYSTPAAIPPNFIRLNDLDANGCPNEVGERPIDEFDLLTLRGQVSRFLADADGDGYTDSFWFMAPTPVEKGIRQIVAVRIIDNSAMVNANVATRFSRVSTTGATPSDIALVGENIQFQFTDPNGNWNTGLLDNPASDERLRVWPSTVPGCDGSVDYNPYGGPYADSFTDSQATWYARDMTNASDLGLWPSFLRERGIGDPGASQGYFLVDDNRRTYWRLAGRQPFTPFGFTPFTASDELELRMYHGQNYPWIVSRFERSLDTTNPQFSILRTSIRREESSGFLDQLRNRELVSDLRSKMTLFSGARNETLPPWLQWRWGVPSDFINPNFPLVENNFRAQGRLKLDLREAAAIDLELGEQSFEERLPTMLLHALTDGNNAQGRGYYGEYTQGGGGFGGTDVPAELQQVRRLAGAYAANILAYRDEDTESVVEDDPNTPVRERGAIRCPSSRSATASGRRRRRRTSGSWAWSGSRSCWRPSSRTCTRASRSRRTSIHPGSSG